MIQLYLFRVSTEDEKWVLLCFSIVIVFLSCYCFIDKTVCKYVKLILFLMCCFVSNSVEFIICETGFCMINKDRICLLSSVVFIVYPVAELLLVS